jgi:hypothetical protein
MKPWAATRVRVRVQYERTTALTGQLFGPWRYVQDYLLAVPFSPAPGDATLGMIKEEIIAKKAAVTIYPNPVSDKLFIDAPGEISSLLLLAANGRTVYQSTTGEKEVDVRNLASGAYIVIITHIDGACTTRKVVIRK